MKKKYLIPAAFAGILGASLLFSGDKETPTLQNNGTSSEFGIPETSQPISRQISRAQPQNLGSIEQEKAPELETYEELQDPIIREDVQTCQKRMSNFDSYMSELAIANSDMAPVILDLSSRIRTASETYEGSPCLELALEMPIDTTERGCAWDTTRNLAILRDVDETLPIPAYLIRRACADDLSVSIEETAKVLARDVASRHNYQSDISFSDGEDLEISVYATEDDSSHKWGNGDQVIMNISSPDCQAKITLDAQEGNSYNVKEGCIGKTLEDVFLDNYNIFTAALVTGQTTAN